MAFKWPKTNCWVGDRQWFGKKEKGWGQCTSCAKLVMNMGPFVLQSLLLMVNCKQNTMKASSRPKNGFQARFSPPAFHQVFGCIYSDTKKLGFENKKKREIEKGGKRPVNAILLGIWYKRFVSFSISWDLVMIEWILKVRLLLCGCYTSLPLGRM